MKSNLAEMVLVRSRFKIVSHSPTLHSRWLPLLEIKKKKKKKINGPLLLYCMSKCDLKFKLQLPDND